MVESQESDLSEAFFSSSTTSLAKKLLGMFLVSESDRGVSVGRIVETEAYLSRNDPACHASKGMTKRNAQMFGEPGRGYVYLIYGMYHCFNVVTAKNGVGEAVLVRALEPVHGIELMQKRRGGKPIPELCSGPGKLTIALGINEKHNGGCLRTGPLKLYSREAFPDLASPMKRVKVVQTTRIGITKGAELPLRFYIEGSSFVSKT